MRSCALVAAVVLFAACFMARVEGRTHIVVPCYNEEKRLPKQQLLDFTADAKNSEIFFTLVNDGSKDRTLEILKELSNANPSQIAVFDMPSNGGKAEAVRNGMLHVINSRNLTSSDLIAFWDADWATPLQTIPKFVETFERFPRVEMVFGARVALLGRDIQREMIRHYLGRIFATLASMVLNLSIYDTQCGAKMFMVTEDLRRVLSQPFSTGWIFDVEMIARFIYLRAGTANLPCENVIYEYPLEQWHDIAGSKLGFTSKIKALYGLGSIWYDYMGPFAGWSPSALQPEKAEL